VQGERRSEWRGVRLSVARAASLRRIEQSSAAAQARSGVLRKAIRKAQTRAEIRPDGLDACLRAPRIGIVTSVDQSPRRVRIPHRLHAWLEADDAARAIVGRQVG